MKRLAALAAMSALVVSPFVLLAAPTQAAVSSWQKGASILPQSPTDFGSATLQQSLRNLKATGATYVSLVVPYYQSNTSSSDIAPGYNTPTDAALGSAIDYAHSIGLSVALKVHVEPYTGEWRAYINPSNRNTWYAAMNSTLVHLGQLGQSHHAELIVLGTEMVSTASSAINSDNTERWQGMIANVRKVYSGALTYDANSTDHSNDPFSNEKASIGFWSSLDYAGLSVYYNLNTNDNSVQSLMGQWDYWNRTDIAPFQKSIGKPLLFTEVGYKSVSGAHLAPWDSGRSGSYDAQEQVNDYQAFMQYWNNYSYVSGVYWWNWSSNPNAGGSGDTDYTVQNKPAQQTLTQWFGAAQPPSNPTPPSITASASASPTNPAANSGATVAAQVKNTGGALTFGIVDVEIYNAGGQRMLQQFFDNQTINTGETKSYSVSWGGGPAGQYRVAVGVFNSDWSQNYAWNNSAATISAGSASPPPNNPPPNNPPPANYSINLWWPTDGSTVEGTQPFKANMDGLDVSQYSMYWQVDGDALNVMGNSTSDYPHKEADVDVSGWHWSQNGQYTLTFISKDGSGKVLAQKSVVIHTQ